MKRLLWRIVFGLIALIVLVFVLDNASWRLGIPPRPQYSSINVNRMYAVPTKAGKTEFMPDTETATETCANSLLPQPGYRPCWWLKDHTRERIDVK